MPTPNIQNFYPGVLYLSFDTAFFTSKKNDYGVSDAFFVSNFQGDPWNSGDPYEYFMGRWSKMVAPVFLAWLKFPQQFSWLDMGCGTGSLGEAIQQTCNPLRLSCVDPSPGFLEKARHRLGGNAECFLGDASEIPLPDKSFDLVVSGLALNFFPNLGLALSEMKRVLNSNGTIAAYVWDYADRMDFLRFFWDAAQQENPGVEVPDEGIRFRICHSGRLREAFREVGLTDIETSHLDIHTVFRDFDDYWNPFLGAQGPAPGYLASLDEKDRQKIKSNLQKRLPVEPDGSIRLLARAIAVKGRYRGS